MKLSCTPISFSRSFRENRLTLREFIEICASEQLDGIDLLDDATYEWLWRQPDAEREVVRWVSDAGLRIAAFAAGNNFAQPDPVRHAEQVELVKHAIEKAAALGTSVIRVFGGYHSKAGGDPSIESENGLRLVESGLEACLATAESCGVVIALENHGLLPGWPEESLGILEHFRSPWLQATFDPANYLGNTLPHDADAIEACQKLEGRMAHVHLKDVRPPVVDLTRRREPCVAGEGITPLREVCQLLDAQGYGGYCALEYEASHIVPEQEGVKASLAYLRSLRKSFQTKDILK